VEFTHCGLLDDKYCCMAVSSRLLALEWIFILPMSGSIYV
jgi:hypothetical protein